MSNLFDKDWDLTEVARILTEDIEKNSTKEDKMNDAMIRAANKAEISSHQLMDTLIQSGLTGVYNLGMQHMLEYLKGDD